MPEQSSKSLLSGVRPRAALALVVLAVIVATVSVSTPVLAVAAVMGALLVAVLVRPSIRPDWRFNVAVGLAVAAYGVAYALGQPSLWTGAIAVLVVAVGLSTVANHLGIAPWSDHPRQI